MTAHISKASNWLVALSAQSQEQELPDLDTAGGKGASLFRLVQAGFPVPDGFLVKAQAYQAFVAENGLQEAILAALPAGKVNDPALLESASSRIQSLFLAGSVPESLCDELLAAYRRLGASAVAVRSSATAEDLPEMSFAGQQDTYLNVVGEAALLKAIVACWSSLWTGRAIGYRMRNGIPQDTIALAVIVQQMVESRASGVLFTANPLTGLRSEAVIDATFGLGEALVSGQVEPDQYTVDLIRESIVSKSLGAKGTSLHGQDGGGTLRIEEDRKDQQALPDEQILELARLGKQIADSYAFPQDIEWAWTDEKLYVLQSRPITSLFPTPEGMPSEPLKVTFSVAAVQGMLDPITPLGRDALRQVFATGAGLFGVQVTPETQTVLYTAGERLWINITPIMRNAIGRKVAQSALSLVEPSTRQAMQSILDDPRLQPGKRRVSLHAIRQMAGFFLPLAANVLSNLRSPKTRRERILRNGELVLEEMRARADAISGDRYDRLAQQADLLVDIARKYLPRAFLLYVSAVASGMASWNLLKKLASDLPETGPRTDQEHAPSSSDLILEVTRGLPYNPTTEMDLALWDISQNLRHDPDSWQAFQNASPQELAFQYQQGSLPVKAQQILQPFLERYGARGLAEIDLGRQRWREDPTHIFEMLSGFLKVEEQDRAPDVVFARSANNARQAINQIVSGLRKARFGWLKSRLGRFFAGRMRELMGLRESPKFFAVRMMGLLRQELLNTGRMFVESGELVHADDLMYLTFSELRALANRQERDWQALILQRREAYQRELLRRQVPRLLLSDGRAFYEGIRTQAEKSNTLAGSPVSPGSVQGRVRLVFDPSRAGLLPGEILVCPGTDPSWTPLFLTAAGLVMEVGGMMTHGAVVAREYGIPAVVGVDRATQRLQTGQWIAVDGSEGVITILPDR